MKRKYEVDREMSYAEIGRIMGITRQRVEQIEKSALKKLSKPELLEKWLEVQETYEELIRPQTNYSISRRRKRISSTHLSETETQLKD